MTEYAARAELLDGMSFRAHTRSGHTLTLDTIPENGGQERGPRPMEMVLVALASCTAMDVISILRKMRQDVTAYEVRIRDVERAAEHPKVYTKITVEHAVRGRNLSEANVARAVELSATTYCPVSAMLEKGAAVKHVYVIEQET